MIKSRQLWSRFSRGIIVCVGVSFSGGPAQAGENDPWDIFQGISFPSNPQTTDVLANGYGLYGVKYHGSIDPNELHFMYYAVTEKGTTKCDYRAARLMNGESVHWFEVKETKNIFNFGTHQLSRPVDVVSYTPLNERDLQYILRQFESLSAYPPQPGYTFPKDMTPELLHATLRDPLKHLNCYQIGCLMPEMIDDARRVREIEEALIGAISPSDPRPTLGRNPFRGMKAVGTALGGLPAGVGSAASLFLEYSDRIGEQKKLTECGVQGISSSPNINAIGDAVAANTIFWGSNSHNLGPQAHGYVASIGPNGQLQYEQKLIPTGQGTYYDPETGREYNSLGRPVPTLADVGEFVRSVMSILQGPFGHPIGW